MKSKHSNDLSLRDAPDNTCIRSHPNAALENDFYTSNAARKDCHPISSMRVQKFLSRAGVASRRGSEKLMSAGRVSVNGAVVTQLGSKLDPYKDVLCVDGSPITLKDSCPVVLMLHKPAGVLSTMSDPYSRPTVAKLVPIKRYPGLFPVGRLDKNTTGLLLFTTDGNLGNALLKPAGHVEKTYVVLLNHIPEDAQLRMMETGIVLDGRPTLPAKVELLSKDDAAALTCFDASALPNADGNATLRMQPVPKSFGAVIRMRIHEGRKRQIRRMCEKLGLSVLALHREAFGPLSLGDLARGAYRELSPQEIAKLRAACNAGSC